MRLLTAVLLSCVAVTCWGSPTPLTDAQLSSAYAGSEIVTVTVAQIVATQNGVQLSFWTFNESIAPVVTPLYPRISNWPVCRCSGTSTTTVR